MKREFWIAILIAALVSGSVLAYVALLPRKPIEKNQGPSPTFNVQVDPNATRAIQGGQVNVTVTVVSQKNFNSQVFLRLSGIPPGISTLWDSQVLIPARNESLSTTLSLIVDVTVLPGDYPLAISGSGGGVVRSVTVLLSVLELPPSPTFALAVNPTKLVVVQGQSDLADVTVRSLYGFNFSVTLTVTNVAGVNSTFQNDSNTTSVRPPVNGSLTVRLTVGVLTSATPGLHTLTITASNNTLTRVRPLQLVISRPPVRFTLYAWAGGWNSSNPDPSRPCSPPRTPSCNPDLPVLVWQKVEFTIVGSDPVTHDLAYYPGGYDDSRVSIYNPDALNRSSDVYQTNANLVYIFTTAGTYEYYCEYHVSTSHGRVVVAESLATTTSLSAAADEQGAAALSQPQLPWPSNLVVINGSVTSVAVNYRVRSPIDS